MMRGNSAVDADAAWRCSDRLLRYVNDIAADMADDAKIRQGS